ncbi:MAG: hypothetical protein Hyperionvirus40_15 [Hyperionvirus sp.]|uniref:Uncharacterized protein n=1 Tax=Hyperionvirus sp. TaxID=2487770 RepID=A0A3G5AEV3_9VIRU|nr:MAG: hypothetical protein Hyperionvirus40_15 [Hyperionvirus sp.]
MCRKCDNNNCDSCDDLQCQIDRLARRIAKLKAAIILQNGKIDALTIRVDAAEKAIVALQAQVAQLKGVVGNLSGQVMNLETEVFDLNQQVQELKSTLVGQFSVSGPDANTPVGSPQLLTFYPADDPISIQIFINDSSNYIININQSGLYRVSQSVLVSPFIALYPGAFTLFVYTRPGELGAVFNQFQYFATTQNVPPSILTPTTPSTNLLFSSVLINVPAATPTFPFQIQLRLKTTALLPPFFTVLPGSYINVERVSTISPK